MSRKKVEWGSPEHIKALKAGVKVDVIGTPKMATDDQLAAKADTKKIKDADAEYEKASERAAKNQPRSYDGLPQTHLGMPDMGDILANWKNSRNDTQYAKNVIAAEKAAKAARNQGGTPTAGKSKGKPAADLTDGLEVAPKGGGKNSAKTSTAVLIDSDTESKGGCLRGGCLMDGCSGWVVLIILILAVFLYLYTM